MLPTLGISRHTFLMLDLRFSLTVSMHFQEPFESENVRQQTDKSAKVEGHQLSDQIVE